MPLKDGIDHYGLNIQHPPDCQRMRNLCESPHNRQGFPELAPSHHCCPSLAGGLAKSGVCSLRFLTLACATSMLRASSERWINRSAFRCSDALWVTFWS